MTVKIEIYGEIAEEALRELRDLTAGLAPNAASQSLTAAIVATSTPVPVASETAAPKATRARKAKADEPASQISTGENRVGPEDDAETAEQDVDDEAAEVEANKKPETPLTGDDLRNAMGAYVTKFGMPATQEDGPKIFMDAIGKPPAGEEFWKLSAVANAGQEALAKAVTAWQKAGEADKRYGAA